MLPLLLALVTGAWASDPADRAEYFRIAQEMQMRASRGAWTGVERAYEAVQRLGVQLAVSDHLLGATAAQQMGDVATARLRLLQAHAVQEQREVVDWLWQIDSRYGPVKLVAHAAELIPVSASFRPDDRRAVEHAAQQLAEEGSFTGYLPAGRYLLDGVEFVVEAWGDPVRIEVDDSRKHRRRR